MIRRTPVVIEDKRLELSNLDKPMYPEAGFTKGDVIDYYSRIAPVMLPHVRGRPLSMKRYPDGVEGKFFYQKNCPGHRPRWVSIVSVRRGSNRSKSEEPIEYCVIEDAASLLWMANLASLELHTHLSTAEDVDRPTMMVFDLDPGPDMSLLDCLIVGTELRELLAELELECFVKTSGGKGAHLIVPLNTKVTFDETKAFSRALAEVLERRDPRRITTTMRKQERGGRVFVDWSQNDRHKTTVCAYSLRAMPRPTVSTPLGWDEVERAVKRGDACKLVFEAPQVLDRIESVGDLLAPALTLKQRLSTLQRMT